MRSVAVVDDGEKRSSHPSRDVGRRVSSSWRLTRNMIRSSASNTVAAALTAVLLVAMVVDVHAETNVKVGVLKFGTVNWELDVMKFNNYDKKQGINVEVVKYGSGNTAKIAIQGKAIDVIVSDWIWVARQRSEGKKFTFAPYSLAVGSVMVAPDSGVKTVADLAGKRFGVAGGPVDKSWLLLRAYSKKTSGTDIGEAISPEFAAPPLINKMMMKGDLDAVVNFWHYGARLEAAGMQPLIQVADILPELGVDGPIPLLGWVFDREWAVKNPNTVDAFLKATYRAKRRLLDSDEEWERIRDLTKAEDDKTFFALRDTWRAGVPKSFGEAEMQRAAKAYSIMAEIGGEKLTGEAKELSEGTFWEKADLSNLN